MDKYEVGGIVKKSHKEGEEVVIDEFELQEVSFVYSPSEEKPKSAMVFLQRDGIISGIELHNYNESGQVFEKKRLHDRLAEKALVDIWRVIQGLGA